MQQSFLYAMRSCCHPRCWIGNVTVTKAALHCVSHDAWDQSTPAYLTDP